MAPTAARKLCAIPNPVQRPGTSQNLSEFSTIRSDSQNLPFPRSDTRWPYSSRVSRKCRKDLQLCYHFLQVKPPVFQDPSPHPNATTCLKGSSVMRSHMGLPQDDGGVGQSGGNDHTVLCSNLLRVMAGKDMEMQQETILKC